MSITVAYRSSPFPTWGAVLVGEKRKAVVRKVDKLRIETYKGA